MKPSVLMMIALLLCPFVIAEEAAPETTATPPAVIGQRYVRDYILVPVRSGQSEAYRILHRGIRSGTRVDLLETNEDSGYSRIRLSNGIDGWIGTQYLQEEPTADVRLQEAQRTIQRLSSASGSTGAKLLELENENQALKQELQQTQNMLTQTRQELEHLQSISSNAVALDEDNKRLLKENEAMKNRRDTLKAENDRLEDALQRDEFFNGALAVILGIIATLAIQYFQRSRRRTEWA